MLCPAVLFARKVAIWLADAQTTAFAFTVHFQAGAVDDQIDLAVIFRNVNVDSEFRRPFLE